MKYPTSLLQRCIESWPGKKTFGVYRFLPLFVGIGAALEFSMIKWTVGQTNFCEFPSFFNHPNHSPSPYPPADHTFKQRRAKEIVAERLSGKQQHSQ